MSQHAYIGRHVEGGLRDPHGVTTARETELAEQIFTKLWWSYPGRDWKVHVDIPGGICAIKLPRLMHSALGFNFPLSALLTDPDMRIVVRAGGELLERLALTRGRFNKTEMVDAVQRRRVFRKDDFAGQLAIDQHTTRERPRLIVPAQYANDNVEDLKGRAIAMAAQEIAAAAARPVTEADVDSVIRRIEAA